MDRHEPACDHVPATDARGVYLGMYAQRWTPIDAFRDRCFQVGTDHGSHPHPVADHLLGIHAWALVVSRHRPDGRGLFTPILTHTPPASP